MEIKIIEQHKACIVSVTGKMEAATAPKLEKAISGYVASAQKPIILNFENLNFISSAGLRVVLFSAKQLKTKKQDLLISGLNGSVKNVFELSGFYSIFKIFETIEAALEKIV
ncbi:MAG: STAS domain-containing protein [Proteobacteria bacterium]|nr:STAS domain-containing protein [Pseudomonadota bacterium]MBU1584012.1 STAS domain-containing protein [Pseudomonadota bacterium]MBU2630904.1 STAS domain-containing protein [Pseudomonadota bacterium]